jgi:hypothetical protein
VTLYPNVRRIRGKTVLFENGASAMFDAVIFATGYHPELRHLHGLLSPTTSLSYATAFDMEKQHIFLVGLDNLYNYRSRYIRGMRSDAKVVVEKIKQAVLTYPNPDNS